MNRLDALALHRRFQERVSSTAALSLTSFKQVTPTLAKVVITHANLEKLSKDQIRHEIASLFDFKASPVEASFRSIHTTSLPAIVGFVRVNRESKPYNQKEVASLRVLAANMFMDETDDSLWSVKATGDGQKMLCRQVKEDIAQLLETAAVHVHRAPELSSIASYALPGDVVAYVDPKTETVKRGIVLSLTQVDMVSAQKPQVLDDADGNSERLVVFETPGTHGDNESDERRGVDEPIADRLNAEAGDGLDNRYTDGLALTGNGSANESDETRAEGNRVAERMGEEAGFYEIHPEMLVSAATLKEVQEAAAEDAPTNSGSRQALKQYWAQIWNNMGPEGKDYDKLWNQMVDSTFA